MRLVDTNILFYAFDRTQGKKHEQAKSLFKQISLGEAEGCVSNQVLAELYSALTTKLKERNEIARAIIAGIIETESWKKINYTSDTVASASQLSEKFKAPFWDALIAQTMLENNIREIVTEDDAFSKIPAIKAANPFK
ncbi:MAG: PIN domain-containing protein [Candidatus Micrarchaeota archaeon]|nr:PIN domain-containing protein [Candidatus Micrarchaeota archaeon]